MEPAPINSSAAHTPPTAEGSVRKPSTYQPQTKRTTAPTSSVHHTHRGLLTWGAGL